MCILINIYCKITILTKYSAHETMQYLLHHCCCVPQVAMPKGNGKLIVATLLHAEKGFIGLD